MKRQDTQKVKVLEHLQKYGTITPMVALKDYGCFRLAAVIFRLKKDGYNIETHRITGKDDDGSIYQFAVYELKGEI